MVDMSDNFATIECGNCGHTTRVQLGLACAVACPKCKHEIVLGEDGPDLGVMIDDLLKACELGAEIAETALAGEEQHSADAHQLQEHIDTMRSAIAKAEGK